VSSHPSDFYAVAANQVLPGTEPNNHEILAQHLQEAGITLVRTRVLRWRLVQPSPLSEPDWGLWPQIYDAYTSRGIKIVVPILDAPAWAVNHPNPNIPNRHPPRLEQWNAFIESAAARFRGQVFAWEMWNEPDVKNFFNGSPIDYLLLLNTGYLAVKRGDPEAEVWGPATMPRHMKSRKKKKANFTKYAVQYGLMDRFAYHDYAGKAASKVSNYEFVVGLLGEYGRELPIVITETNKAPANCEVFDALTDAELAEFLGNVYQALGSAGASAVFWWKPVDTYSANCQGGVLRDGLLTPQYQPKAAYWALKELIGSA
jgi:hypothetical protein